MSDITHERIKKIKENKYLLVLLLILTAAFFLRLEVFSVNINQSYWWDEATYLNSAKFWAFGEPEWSVEGLRPPLFMFILSLLFKIGLNETAVRFIAILIPSILLVIVTYLLGKELFNKKTGLIAAAVTAAAWNLLFNTSRVHTDIPYTLAIISTVYFFYKGYVKEENIKRNLIITGALFAAAYSIRETALTFVPAFGIYILLKEKHRLIKQKKLLYIIIPALILAVPYFAYGLINYNHIAPWFAGRYQAVTVEYADAPITSSCFMMLGTNLSPAAQKFQFTNLISYINSLWFILLIAGIIFLLRYLIIIDKVIKKPEDKTYRSEIFLFIFFAATILFFTFVNKNCAEPRWIMPIVILGILIISYILYKLYKYLKPKNKYFALIIIIALVLIGSYQNIQHNNKLIEIKKTSFSELVDIGNIIKQSTEKNEIIYSLTAQAELQYTSERKVKGISGKDEKEMLENIIKDKPKYLIIGLYVTPGPSEQWKIIYPYQNLELFPPLKAYPPLISNQIPLVTIFKVNHDEINKKLETV